MLQFYERQRQSNRNVDYDGSTTFLSHSTPIGNFSESNVKFGLGYNFAGSKSRVVCKAKTVIKLGIGTNAPTFAAG